MLPALSEQPGHVITEGKVTVGTAGGNPAHRQQQQQEQLKEKESDVMPFTLLGFVVLIHVVVKGESPPPTHPHIHLIIYNALCFSGLMRASVIFAFIRLSIKADF